MVSLHECGQAEPRSHGPWICSQTCCSLRCENEKLESLGNMDVSKILKYEPQNDKTNKMTCESSEDSDQPGHPPSLIRVFTVGMKKVCVLSYPLSAQQRLIRPGCTGHFVGFVVLWLVLFGVAYT